MVTFSQWSVCKIKEALSKPMQSGSSRGSYSRQDPVFWEVAGPAIRGEAGLAIGGGVGLVFECGAGLDIRGGGAGPAFRGEVGLGIGGGAGLDVGGGTALGVSASDSKESVSLFFEFDGRVGSWGKAGCCWFQSGPGAVTLEEDGVDSCEKVALLQEVLDRGDLSSVKLAEHSVLALAIRLGWKHQVPLKLFI
jgi:hypothetical protein